MQAILPADVHYHDKLSSDCDNLRGQCHEIFNSGSFMDNLPPNKFSTAVNLTGGKFCHSTTGFIDTGGKIWAQQYQTAETLK
jgi:hypothetical protein